MRIICLCAHFSYSSFKSDIIEYLWDFLNFIVLTQGHHCTFITVHNIFMEVLNDNWVIHILIWTICFCCVYRTCLFETYFIDGISYLICTLYSTWIFINKLYNWTICQAHLNARKCVLICRIIYNFNELISVTVIKRIIATTWTDSTRIPRIFKYRNSRLDHVTKNTQFTPNNISITR